MKSLTQLVTRNFPLNLMRRLIGRNAAVAMLAMFALIMAGAPRAQAASANIVIAELYSAGGNAGATYQNDYVVLFNRGTTGQSVNGWSVQYASATGNSWNNKVNLPDVTIPAGGYFLIKMASGGAVGAVLPLTEDLVSAINMSGTAGKLALVNSITQLPAVTCPTSDPSVVDFIGYGATAKCFETVAAPAPSSTTCLQRGSGGCTETDNNSTDFTATASFSIRNSSSAGAPCSGGSVGPVISADPQPVEVGVGLSAQLTVLLSQGTPPLFYQWYKDNAPIGNGGSITGATTQILKVTSAFHTNAGDYKVVVTNSIGSVTSAPAALTVIGFAITPVLATNTITGVPVTVNLSFIDNQTPVTIDSATSGNQTLLPNANITITPAGGGYNLTLSPVAAEKGVAVVTITASAGSYSTSASFPLMVVTSESIVFNDFFDYADGSLGTNSGFLWRNHGGTAGDLQLSGSQAYLSRSASEDVNALLIGQPYSPTNPGSLYAKFVVNFSNTDTPTFAGTYFAHFKDAEFGFRARVWASTNASGALRLGIGNGSSATNGSGMFPLDLSYNTPYTVVARIDLHDGTSTLWVNPTSQNDASVTANDGDSVANAITVTSFALRQNSGMSKLFFDDLVVATSFDAATGLTTTPPAAPTLTLTPSGADAVLTWSNPSFLLQSAPVVTGPYAAVLGATSPYNAGMTNAQRYFRLKY